MTRIYREHILYLLGQEAASLPEEGLSLRSRVQLDIKKAMVGWKVSVAVAAVSKAPPFWAAVLTVPSEMVDDPQNAYTQQAKGDQPQFIDDTYQEFIEMIEGEGFEVKLGRTCLSPSQFFYQIVVKMPRL